MNLMLVLNEIIYKYITNDKINYAFGRILKQF